MRSLAVAAICVAVWSLVPTGGQAAPGTDTSSGATVAGGPDREAVTRLEAAVEQGRTAAFDARLLVISFDSTGPNVVELDVSQSEGQVRVSRGEAWTLGRAESGAYFTRAGELLQLGSVSAPGFDPRQVSTKYRLQVAGTRELDTGAADPIEIVEREAEVLRERLYVDQRTGVVVRRETFGADSEPVRLAAFTDLRLRTHPLEGPGVAADAVTRDLASLSDESLSILDEVGWHVPRRLPARFELQGGYALPESDGSSVHLVYSDGLYTLSLYEQFGQLDRRSLDEAVAVDRGGVHAYTWPGSQPERLVWSGSGMTFTVVSDAPGDVLMDVAGALPHDDAPSLPGRMVRGLGRVLDWAWPFG